MDQPAETLTAIAAEVFGALRDTRQVALFSSRPGGLTIDNAYRVTPLVKVIRKTCSAARSRPCVI